MLAVNGRDFRLENETDPLAAEEPRQLSAFLTCNIASDLPQTRLGVPFPLRLYFQNSCIAEPTPPDVRTIFDRGRSQGVTGCKHITGAELSCIIKPAVQILVFPIQ